MVHDDTVVTIVVRAIRITTQATAGPRDKDAKISFGDLNRITIPTLSMSAESILEIVPVNV